MRRPVLVLYVKTGNRQIEHLIWRFSQSLMAVGVLEEYPSEMGDNKGYTYAG